MSTLATSRTTWTSSCGSAALIEGRAARYFTLRFELEQASGLSVDLVEDEALTNPYLRDELDRTGVEIVAAA